MYNDKNLTCADCGQEFVFTASEQDFYAQRGFTDPAAARRAEPAARLPATPTAAVARTAATAPAAGTPPVVRGGGYGGGGYGSRDRGPREMFSATCSSCGREAQVPFRPTSGKPVYCSDCFRSQRGG